MAARPGATVGRHADNFQPDFYVASATVIPVLFLAVAVEGRVYQWALGTSEWAQRYSSTTARTALGRGLPAWWARSWHWASRLRTARSRQEYVQWLRTEYVQLLRAALITFGGTRLEVKALPPEGRRESSIRPPYDG
jgi:hypothetical protein